MPGGREGKSKADCDLSPKVARVAIMKQEPRAWDQGATQVQAQGQCKLKHLHLGGEPPPEMQMFQFTFCPGSWTWAAPWSQALGFCFMIATRATFGLKSQSALLLRGAPGRVYPNR